MFSNRVSNRISIFIYARFDPSLIEVSDSTILKRCLKLETLNHLHLTFPNKKLRKSNNSNLKLKLP